VWVDSLAGFLGFVKMDVVEVHPWAATVDDIEHADTLVFDLTGADANSHTTCPGFLPLFGQLHPKLHGVHRGPCCARPA
jgi:hypothetical protein